MNMAAVSVTDEVDIEQRQTLWVGGLNEKVTEEILYELFQNVSFSNISTNIRSWVSRYNKFYPKKVIH